ncbi:YopX family protein [Prevotella jejuni]|uniref:YopX family protein n=1 Tax=Prevotella jejuni TaxID=1177574 RepID=UPI00352E580E
MNREILFRGKKSNGRWVYGSLVVSENIAPAIYYNVSKGVADVLDWCYVKPDTIGQYTGLKDKNGNKIFEGDVVIIGEKLKAKAIYYDGAFRMQSEFSPTPIDTTDMGYMMREFSVRVIGNVHDDPELIK